MWEECRPQFQFSEKMARLLDALYQTNFMELESTSRTPQISYMEASASSFEGHVQVFIASSADSFNSLFVQMGLCTKVDLLKDKILQGWSYGGWDDSQLPGNQYPNWFIYKGEGCSVIFKVPLVKGCRLKAMLLNVVHSSCMDNTMPDQFLISVLIINHTKATVQHYKGDSITFHEDEQCQSIISNIQPDDLVELVFSIGPQFPVKKIAAYLIFDDSKPRRLLK
ncbi:uncharacterized protein LOC129301480 [Prosopis cineraria]|nr:uncharacterized protein LOC129301480 [Prosopis cineraria]